MVSQVKGFKEKYQVSGKNDKNMPGSPEGPTVEVSFVREMSGFRALNSLDDVTFCTLQSWNQGSGSPTIYGP